MSVSAPSSIARAIAAVLLACLNPLPAAAQGWIQTLTRLNADSPWSVRALSDGYVVGALAFGNGGMGNGDYTMIRLDTAGALTQQWRYATPQSDSPRVLEPTPDGGFIFVGTAPPPISGSWLLKLDAAGDIEWQKAYSHPAMIHGVRSVQPTSDGGYVLAGWASDLTNGDVWLLKLTATGAIDWQRRLAPGNNFRVDVGATVIETTDGDFVVAANTASYGAGSIDAWVIRFSPQGAVRWQKAYGTASEEVTYNQGVPGGLHILAEAPAGGFIVALQTEAPVGGALLRLADNGDVIWQRSVTRPDGIVRPMAVLATDDGGFVAAGRLYLFSIDNDIVLFRLDGNGQLQWGRSFGAVGDYEIGYDLDQAADGGYIVLGEFAQSTGDLILVKTDANGVVGADCDIERDISIDVTDFPGITTDTTAPVIDTMATIADTFVARDVIIYDRSLWCGGCTVGPEPLTGLLAFRQGRDVDLMWDEPAGFATDYNLWYVTVPSQIDLAREGSSPPAVGVADCAAPNPTISTSCRDVGALDRVGGVFFYQVRALCGLVEGP